MNYIVKLNYHVNQSKRVSSCRFNKTISHLLIQSLLTLESILFQKEPKMFLIRCQFKFSPKIWNIFHSNKGNHFWLILMKGWGCHHQLNMTSFMADSRLNEEQIFRSNSMRNFILSSMMNGWKFWVNFWFWREIFIFCSAVFLLKFFSRFQCLRSSFHCLTGIKYKFHFR